ncbi:MAG: DUF308 domain-containing protein [Daejeonella sp.]
MNSIQRFLTSKYFKIVVGIFLICSSLYDIIGDFDDIRSEHVTLLIGIILFVDSMDDVISGINNILSTSNNKQVKREATPFKRFINSGGYYLFMGIMITAGSIYEIYDDILRIRKEHLEFVVGIIFIILSIKKIKEAGKEIKSGILREEKTVKTPVNI